MNKVLDAKLSSEVASRINSKSQNCFDNAYKAALLVEGAMYIQGFLAWAGEPYVPVEYSWIELDERIVAPTLPQLNKTRELYFFPAQSLTVAQLKAAVEEAKEDYPDDEPLPIYGTTPYDYYGEVMLGGQEYSAAYKEAEAKCRELNKPKLS